MPPSAGPLDPLTPREQEVVCLLARGNSDRQIAAALTIAVSTAGVHVHHILEKLGPYSRWQAADRAARYGLARARRG